MKLILLFVSLFFPLLLTAQTNTSVCGEIKLYVKAIDFIKNERNKKFKIIDREGTRVILTEKPNGDSVYEKIYYHNIAIRNKLKKAIVYFSKNDTTSIQGKDTFKVIYTISFYYRNNVLVFSKMTLIDFFKKDRMFYSKEGFYNAHGEIIDCSETNDLPPGIRQEYFRYTYFDLLKESRFYSKYFYEYK